MPLMRYNPPTRAPKSFGSMGTQFREVAGPHAPWQQVRKPASTGAGTPSAGGFMFDVGDFTQPWNLPNYQSPHGSPNIPGAGGLAGALGYQSPWGQGTPLAAPVGRPGGSTAGGGMWGGGGQDGFWGPSEPISTAPVYSPEQTARAQSQIQGYADRASDPGYLMKAYTQPGVSRSSATMSAVLPRMASIQSQAMQDAGMTGLEHRLANAMNRLGGQQANFADYLNNLGLYNTYDAMNRGFGRGRERILASLV